MQKIYIYGTIQYSENTGVRIMIHERVYLNPEDHRIYLDTYIADDRHYARPAMLVIPGGGYKDVCSDREGEPIALEYFTLQHFL